MNIAYIIAGAKERNNSLQSGTEFRSETTSKCKYVRFSDPYHGITGKTAIFIITENR